MNYAFMRHHRELVNIAKGSRGNSDISIYSETFVLRGYARTCACTCQQAVVPLFHHDILRTPPLINILPAGVLVFSCTSKWCLVAAVPDVQWRGRAYLQHICRNERIKEKNWKYTRFLLTATSERRVWFRFCVCLPAFDFKPTKLPEFVQNLCSNRDKQKRLRMCKCTLSHVSKTGVPVLRGAKKNLIGVKQNESHSPSHVH